VKFVRVLAVARDGGHTYDNYSIVLLCALDDSGHIANGEWFGYVKNEAVIYPFVLQRGERFWYGGEEQYFEPTNIGKRPIAVGSYFTVFSSPTEEEKWENIYEIKSCHAFQD
jgi:hypothetical protein